MENRNCFEVMKMFVCKKQRNQTEFKEKINNMEFVYIMI